MYTIGQVAKFLGVSRVILCQENGQGKLRFCFKSKRAIACSPHK